MTCFGKYEYFGWDPKTLENNVINIILDIFNEFFRIFFFWKLQINGFIKYSSYFLLVFEKLDRKSEVLEG